VTKTAALIVIGNEILSGKVQDVNSPYFCQELRKLGVNVRRISVIADDPEEIGALVRVWLLEYISSGPVLAVVLEGPHVVELVRKICGNTLPQLALPGTIRGDFSFDSSFLANTAKRAIKNLVHASGSLDEAKYEIPLWFSPEEILTYARVEEKAMR